MTGAPIDIGFISTTGRPIQETYLDNAVAWISEAAALAGIDEGARHPFMPLVIGTTLYWFLADKTTLEPITLASVQAAIDVLITDTAEIYDALNVEDALAEVMAYAMSLDIAIAALPILPIMETINLPAAANLVAKVAAAAETTDYPTGWTLEVTDGVNLTITHGLGKEIDHVTVKKVVGAVKKILKPYSTAYSDVSATTTSILVIEGIDPSATQTLIHLTFMP